MLGKSKVKKITYGKAKAKAWNSFSKFIRLRDCLLSTGRSNEGKCVTCNRTYEFKLLQAGHFIPGRHMAILFDERNAHAQCYSCNMHLRGNAISYFRFMQRKYGEEVIAELEELNKLEKMYKVPELLELADFYDNKAKTLTNP